MGNWTPVDEWATLVESVPVPSVELILSTDDGVVLTRCEGDPTNGE